MRSFGQTRTQARFVTLCALLACVLSCAKNSKSGVEAIVADNSGKGPSLTAAIIFRSDLSALPKIETVASPGATYAANQLKAGHLGILHCNDQAKGKELESAIGFDDKPALLLTGDHQVSRVTKQPSGIFAAEKITDCKVVGLVDYFGLVLVSQQVGFLVTQLESLHNGANSLSATDLKPLLGNYRFAQILFLLMSGSYDPKSPTTTNDLYTGIVRLAEAFAGQSLGNQLLNKEKLNKYFNPCDDNYRTSNELIKQANAFACVKKDASGKALAKFDYMPLPGLSLSSVEDSIKTSVVNQNMTVHSLIAGNTGANANFGALVALLNAPQPLALLGAKAEPNSIEENLLNTFSNHDTAKFVSFFNDLDISSINKAVTSATTVQSVTGDVAEVSSGGYSFPIARFFGRAFTSILGAPIRLFQGIFSGGQGLFGGAKAAETEEASSMVPVPGGKAAQDQMRAGANSAVTSVAPTGNIVPVFQPVPNEFPAAADPARSAPLFIRDAAVSNAFYDSEPELRNESSNKATFDESVVTADTARVTASGKPKADDQQGKSSAPRRIVPKAEFY